MSKRIEARDGKCRGGPKDKENPNGPAYWNNAGMTLFIGEYEGDPTYTIVLATNPDNPVKFFKREQRAVSDSQHKRDPNDGDRF